MPGHTGPATDPTGIPRKTTSRPSLDPSPESPHQDGRHPWGPRSCLGAHPSPVPLHLLRSQRQHTYLYPRHRPSLPKGGPDTDLFETTLVSRPSSPTVLSETVGSGKKVVDDDERNLETSRVVERPRLRFYGLRSRSSPGRPCLSGPTLSGELPETGG